LFFKVKGTWYTGEIFKTRIGLLFHKYLIFGLAAGHPSPFRIDDMIVGQRTTVLVASAVMEWSILLSALVERQILFAAERVLQNVAWRREKLAGRLGFKRLNLLGVTSVGRMIGAPS